MLQVLTLDVVATIFICLYNYTAGDIDVIQPQSQAQYSQQPALPLGRVVIIINLFLYSAVSILSSKRFT